jgi:hypothetical protein
MDDTSYYRIEEQGNATVTFTNSNYEENEVVDFRREFSKFPPKRRFWCKCGKII